MGDVLEIAVILAREASVKKLRLGHCADGALVEDILKMLKLQRIVSTVQCTEDCYLQEC